MSTATSLSREAMDRLLEEHFRYEAEGDVAGTLATYTDDIEHDVVGDPLGTLRDRQAIGDRYAHLFHNVKGEGFAVKHRLYGDNFVVDDKIWTARVDGEFMGLAGHGRQIHVRVLHVFEFRDGRIARENVWLDGASAVVQLTSNGSLAAPPVQET
jgi:ketosteroid isomerase-like protein